MSILIHAKDWDPAVWVEQIRAQAPGRRTVIDIADKKALADVRYALVWKPNPGLLATLPKLEAIFNLGAGVDAILADRTIPPGIPLVRTVDPNMSMRMTEWITLHVLLHHRQLPIYAAQQSKRIWNDLRQSAAEDMTVGILGLGELGISAGKLLRQIGFQVVGWSRTKKSVDGIISYHGPAGLDQLLGQTDILVCLLPLTTVTRGILNADLFSKLKRTGPLGAPVLINAGRGGEQVEKDILAALDNGTLRAASLDVFEIEPLPKESPLWHHPNVVVTPHNAADSEAESLTRYVLGQIARHEGGQPLQNVVDRMRGY